MTQWIERARKQLWSAQQCLEIALHEGCTAQLGEEHKKLREVADQLLKLHNEIVKPIAAKHPRYLFPDRKDRSGK